MCLWFVLVGQTEVLRLCGGMTMQAKQQIDEAISMLGDLSVQVLDDALWQTGGTANLAKEYVAALDSITKAKMALLNTRRCLSELPTRGDE